MAMKNLLFVLLLGWQISQTCAVVQQWPMTILGTQGWSIAANFTTESWEDVRTALYDYAPVHYYDGEFEDHPILGQQQYGLAPDAWIQFNFSGRGQHYTEVLIRRDNIYCLSVKTRRGASLALKDHDHLIEGSTPLSFGDTYSQMFDVVSKGFKHLPKVELGRESLLDSIGTSSEFVPSDPVGDGQLKMVFARFSLMFCESVRILPIYQQISENWPNPTHITSKMADLTVNWGPMSRLIMCHLYKRVWKSAPRSIDKSIEVKTAADALLKVDLILWPTAFKPTDLDGSCN